MYVFIYWIILRTYAGPVILSRDNYNFLSLIFHYHDTSLLSDKHAICQQNSQHFLELIDTYNFDMYNYAVYHSINTVQSTYINFSPFRPPGQNPMYDACM